MVPETQGDVSNSIISEKEPKLLNYSYSVDEVWLLIMDSQWNLHNYYDFSYADLLR